MQVCLVIGLSSTLELPSEEYWFSGYQICEISPQPPAMVLAVSLVLGALLTQGNRPMIVQCKLI